MSHGPATPARQMVLVEFETTDALLVATTRVREESEKNGKAAEWAHHVGHLDTHTPFPIHGLSEALGIKTLRVPWLVFGGAMIGAGGGFLMMTFMNHVDFAINVGGRPTFSWPTQIPITFELGILFGGFGAFFGLLVGLLGLPRHYHPVFESPNFERASIDTYFLSIEVKAGGDAHALAEAMKTTFAPKTVDVVEEALR